MAGTLASPLGRATAAPAVRPLLPANVPALRLPSPRSNEALREVLQREPGRSVWVPETLEYALIRSWRNRPEIASVDELTAVRHFELIIRAAYERAVLRGDALFLAIELETHHGRSRFERAGLEPLEEVITYEIDAGRVPRMPQRRLRLRHVSPMHRDAIDWVARLDLAAFPWLWRNSRLEFEVYLETQGVDVSILESDGEPVAYVGTTLFPTWGHLDRIAVAPDMQGRGYGRAALMLTIDALRRQGARRVGLSTQRTNQRSQRLYERFGFNRTPSHDYQLFGSWCQPHREAARQHP